MARWDRSGSGGTIPEWFFEAVETPFVENRVEVDECDVVYQRWGDGDGDKPGLLFVHGMSAHAHWWDFIAPAFVDAYRPVALSLTGMGDSDYRYEYSGAVWAEELCAVCDHASLGPDTVVVAHSLGGYVAVRAVNAHRGRFGGLALVDSGIRHPDDPAPERPPFGGRSVVYPDRDSACARFRLQPPQPCDNDYILQYIARQSLMPVEGGGWTWKFDEDLPSTMVDVARRPEDYQALDLPLGLIYGADSELFSERTLDYLRSLIGRDFPVTALDGARHHLFLDQPLAFIDALRAMLGAMR